MNELLIKLGNEDLLQRFLYLLFNSMEKVINLYQKEKNNNNFTLVKNHIIYFMLLTFNLKKNYKYNDHLVGDKIFYLASLIKSINSLGDSDETKLLLDILFNLFSEEYVHLDFSLIISQANSNNENENESENNNNQNNNNENDNNMNKEYIDIIAKFYLSKSERKIFGKKEIFEKLYKKLLNFDLSYKTMKSKIELEDKIFYQLNIVQSILLITFSKEKYINKYLPENDENYYEYEILKNIVERNMIEVKEKSGDKYKNLFRKEDLTDDIIKFIFFIFGNEMFIESLVKPLQKMLKITGIDNDFEIINDKGKSLNMERDIYINEFDILFKEMIKKMTENMPLLLKILLKIIYENAKRYFTIEDDNYIPLNVALIFNYIASPRIQRIYEIHPHKYTFIKSLNRLLCNTCFGIEFGEKDQLSIFNQSINGYNSILNDFMKNNIINVDLNDVNNKKYLKELFQELNIDIPEFLYFLDCDFLVGIIDLDNIE